MPKILIDGDGKFNEWVLDFVRGGGASFAVVAIMGPQSSGKSTLLNHLFDTNFAVMNAKTGSGKTTKGILMEKAPNMEPATMVLDLEGTDGKERGEDDKTFEKQSTLFALAVADTVLINMWCKDIGFENTANRSLLRTIFEVRTLAMLSLSQQTTLIFVVRDKPPKTPPELLELLLVKDVLKIWEAVPKPKDHEHTAFTQFFNVNQLKWKIVSSHQKRDNNYRPTLSIFLNSAKKTWDMIKENKDLQVPPYRIDQVKFATVQCEEIVSQKLRLLQSDQAWLELQKNAKIHLVKDFGKNTSLILDASLSKYDEESMNLEENVTKDKRQFLMLEALKVVHPAYMHMLDHIRSEAMQSFKT